MDRYIPYIKIAVCTQNPGVNDTIREYAAGFEVRAGVKIQVDIMKNCYPLAKKILDREHYDVICLGRKLWDIEMENMDGITVARKIREQDPYTILLFVSSYDSYYEQLFEVEPLRFLRKPINPEKFEEYFKIAYGRLMNLDERLHFEFNKRLYQIPYRSIMYMESRRRVIHLIENGGQEYRFYMKMNDLMQEISRVGHMFIRIHCSYVVNYYYIKTFGASEVVLLNGEVLPVSIEYKNEAMKFYMDMAE